MQIGEKYLINCDNWFYAPDGDTYRAVHGTVSAVLDAENVLGVRTNARSTNWYVVVGDMIIAGCQIHYAVRAENVCFDPPMVEIDHNGERNVRPTHQTRIYNADLSGLKSTVGNNATS